MEKKSFDFYQDVKVTVWQRQHFTIEAESAEEAREIAKRYTQFDVSFEDDVDVSEVEWLCDTEELIIPEDNGGCATIEVYEREGKNKGTLIADNAVSKDLSAKKEERELIGYQIDFGEDEWPEGLWSFQVFRTKKDVEDYIFLEELDEKYYDRIVEIYRGDVEEPSFLGARVREFGKNEEVMVDDGLHYYAAIVETDVTVEDDDETMPVFPVGPDGKCISPVDVESGCVYKKAPGMVCPKCGNPLYIEHNDEIDYPFFCPECEENFYGIEVR